MEEECSTANNNSRLAQTKLDSLAIMAKHGLLATNMPPKRFVTNMKGHLMPVLDPNEWNLDDAQEPYALEDNSEVKVRILDVRKDKDKNDMEYLLPRFEIVDEPFSKDFTHFMYIPDKETMDAKRLNRSRFAMVQFLHCFEIDTSRPMDPTEDWNGSEGWVILGIKKDDQYGEQNFVKQFITPK